MLQEDLLHNALQLLLQRDRLGLWEIARERVNGYPCYSLVGSDGTDLLWHAGSCWIVGNREDKGSNVGGMLAYDGALRPDRLTQGVSWAVMGLAKDWVSAPLVACLTGAKLDFELGSASHTVALVGATPLGRGSDGFLGVFDLLPQRINALPAYRMKGEGSRTDVCELLKESAYVTEGVNDAQISAVASGTLDRLHQEADPCVRYDAERKLWIYLDGARSEASFETATPD